MAMKERVRVGGRSARIQAEVHKAVKELQQEADRAELTVPMIAARSGVTPSTIYRRWGDLAELLADVAAERLRPVSDPDDTGAQISDLKAYVEQYAEEFSSPTGRAMLRDIFSSATDATYTGQCCGYTFDHLNVIAGRAKARGEHPIVVQDMVDHVIAPIMYRILFGGGELTEAYWQALLDRAMPATA
ncbi:TetR/AcrR family transcriptional regulator C-terminal ligand-binding domain-containing protein [Rhizobium sp. KVB221]|uniref:TetR/AcrR family transcriptional regulator C-terminal ligand-binding domain-containing protein n=1 Tax=Rhizobium setariae TaxID=2801340 RepID=A0A937CNB9_9HYPH|nr:TetR/AcrR family transcriptional regulator [Rhizobium setariae]MBL0371844.1 TetR/AcrR family transcriptional regulator C-terminal ligand-binding domain-containing protein [Rhizobium setariae]